MAFFDLHCHPGLKTLFLPQDGNQLSVWRDISPPDHVIGDILESQCSFKQIIQEGEVNLVCLTLYPPEIGILDQFLLKIGSIVFQGLIDRNRLEEMATLTVSYQEVFFQEFANITAGPGIEDQIDPAKKIKFLQRWADYDAKDADTLHVVFNFEGGHAFYDLKNKIKNIENVIRNFNAFIDKGYKVLYLTPAHLTPNEFMTHAYGNKLLSKGPLLPKGIGITAYGKRLMVNALKKNVLIDVKHMSLVSRRIFYKYRKQNFPDLPIIASHIGLAGESWTVFTSNRGIINPRKKSYGYKVAWLKNRGELEGTYFFPLSINFYNEDIREILESNGLIGISMDVRILGGKGNPSDLHKDFYSHEEYELLTSARANEKIEELFEHFDAGDIDNGNLMLKTINPEPQEIDDLRAVDEELTEIFSTYKKEVNAIEYKHHIRLVVNQLIRIWQITDWEGMSHPWDNICIGSDFDGLIETLQCCRNSTAFASFAQALKVELASVLLAYPKIEHSAAEIIDKFMFKNGSAFLEKWF
ncbi:membrane dipeptidase [Pedobacter immunditicola]|uniref:membrane dipeptidase n=1 Tax=Pedobacter immunditicola TaxID=3133440 RepID=UPI0030A49A5E